MDYSWQQVGRQLSQCATFASWVASDLWIVSIFLFPATEQWGGPDHPAVSSKLPDIPSSEDQAMAGGQPAAEVKAEETCSSWIHTALAPGLK